EAAHVRAEDHAGAGPGQDLVVAVGVDVPAGDVDAVAQRSVRVEVHSQAGARAVEGAHLRPEHRPGAGPREDLVIGAAVDVGAGDVRAPCSRGVGHEVDAGVG